MMDFHANYFNIFDQNNCLFNESDGSHHEVSALWVVSQSVSELFHFVCPTLSYCSTNFFFELLIVFTVINK